MSKTINQIKQHEGLRLKMYQCTAGCNTIGYGRNLDDVGISQDEAEYMLLNDVNKVFNQLNDNLSYFAGLNEARQAVLINMAFNMGYTGLMRFKKFLSDVENGFFEKASREMLDSIWATQVGMRSYELSQQMKTGEFYE